MSVYNIIKDKQFINIDPIKLDRIEIIGYFPYERRRIINKSPKIPACVIQPILDALNNVNITDNKIVVVCKDLFNFGTSSFAIFIHDGGIRIGKLSDIEDY